MSNNKVTMAAIICIFVFLNLIIIALTFDNYHNIKLEIEKYQIDAYSGQTRYSVKESHVFYAPDKHQVIIQLPDWLHMDIDPNEEIVDMDETDGGK